MARTDTAVQTREPPASGSKKIHSVRTLSPRSDASIAARVVVRTNTGLAGSAGSGDRHHGHAPVSPQPTPPQQHARGVPCFVRRHSGIMQAAQQQELEAMTDMFNKCAAPPRLRCQQPSCPPRIATG